MLTIQDLRPCLLVPYSVSRHGGQHYTRENEEKIVDDQGREITEWQTTKTLDDPEEFAEATRLQGLAKRKIAKLGVHLPIGLVVASEKEEQAWELYREWKAKFDEFNTRAKHTRVEFNMGVFHVRGDNAQMLQQLIDELADGLGNLEKVIEGVDYQSIREAMKKVMGFGEMLPERVAYSLDNAIKVAKKRADGISKSEKRVQRIEARLAKELGPNADVAAELEKLRQTEPTRRVAGRLKRVAELARERQVAFRRLEQAKKAVNAAPIRLARFAVVRPQDEQDESSVQDQSPDLYATQAAQRFAGFASEPSPSNQ